VYLDDGSIALSQRRYSEEILERFDMDTSQQAKTPLLAGNQLPPILPDAPEPDPETRFIYQCMIGSLMPIEGFWASPTAIGGETCPIADLDHDMYPLLSDSRRPSLH
jgi:hypothetical protein